MTINYGGIEYEYIPFTDYGKLSKKEQKKYFYTATPIEKEVSKQEFENFINNYPRKLEKLWSHHSSEICMYSDNQLAADGLYNVVALYSQDLYSGDKTYTITVNYDELYNTRTGVNEVYLKQYDECKKRCNYKEYNFGICQKCNTKYKLIALDEFYNELYECPKCHNKVWVPK